MTTPRDARWMGAPFPATSLDDALRITLARLDTAKATAEQVRDALAAAGVYVSERWASEWLAERRAG